MGPHNGTPFRAIITGDLPIEGRNVVELGIHGFMNAANYMQWAREQGRHRDQWPRRAAAGDG